MKNYILAPPDTNILVDDMVLIVTGVTSNMPTIAKVTHINEHTGRYTLNDEYNTYYRYKIELKLLAEDPTPILGPIINEHGNGAGKYDFVETTEISVVKGTTVKKFMSHTEYALRTKMQTLKDSMTIEQRSTFIPLWEEWGQFNDFQGEKREAEHNAGASI